MTFGHNLVLISELRVFFASFWVKIFGVNCFISLLFFRWAEALKLAIQADKPKDDWYKIVEELRIRKESNKELMEISPKDFQDSVALDSNGSNEERRSSRTSLSKCLASKACKAFQLK